MKLPFAQKIQAITETSLNKAQYNLAATENGSQLYTDSLRRVVKLTWHGVVEKSEAIKLLGAAADLVEFEDYKKLVIDRSELIEFDTETRIWIKKFLQMRAKRIAGKVEKLAYVNPKSTKGSIFGNMISSAISLIIPSLTIEKFSLENEATEWLIA